MSLPCVTSAQSSPSLYDQAVSAYENDNLLRALQLINQCLKATPENKQAQKLKELIDSTLHSADSASGGATGLSDSPWSYYQGANTLESAPESLHVFHSANGATADHAYATMSLGLPSKVTEYEVIFRLKYGTLGNVPTGVYLRAGEKVLSYVVAESDGQRTFGNDSALGHKKLDGGWHEYRMWWRGGQLEFRCDDELVAHGPCKDVPNLLQFGGLTGKSGRQTEAYFQWVGLNYNVPG